ncbi:MAG TPA: hypothetical protein P5569_07635 [Candidatus Latescibacteria bacterium]|nr:hypothetical protein [Candidatus Latescibacterota bacterium]
MNPAVTALADPVRAKQVLSGRVITDPVDGREKFWITNMNEQSGGELISVDFDRDNAEVFGWPAGHGSWCVLPLPKDRLAISTYYDGKFLLFDMVKRQFTYVIDFPGESYIWTMAEGSDGRVYGGTYSGAKLGCFDPDSGKFEDCGSPVAGTGNLYLRTVTTTPGGDIACTFGYERSSTQVYRVAKRRFEYLLPGNPDFTGSPLVSLRGHLFVSDGERGLMAFQGPELKPVDRLPLPKCPGGKAWTGVARFSTDERVYLTVGQQLWLWLPETGRLALVHDVDLRGGNIFDVAADGRLLGIRGQDYFVAQPGTRTIALRRIPAESKGRPFHFMAADLPGSPEPHRIWGGPPFGQTVACYEIGSGKVINTGAVVDSGGEVYGGVALNGKIYTASYAGADFAVYDPAQPWNQWEGINPRHLGSIKTHRVCRPTGRMYLAPDGNLYSGWQANYGEYGGALARLNPATEEITVWRNPLGDEPIISLAVDDTYAYMGTDHSANGLPRREGKGQFGVWSLKEERVVFQRRMETMEGVGHIGVSTGPRLAMFPEGDELHVFNAERMEFERNVAAAVPDSPGWCEDVLRSFDGTWVLYARRNYLIKVHRDLSVEVLPPIEHAINHMAFGPDGNLYFSSGTTLYVLEGL